MHIFCDESGGTDAASDEFLVSAVLISPAVAARLMRQFRKKAKPRLSHEIKGHQLTQGQRALFFRLLTECEEVRAVVAACRRSDEVGGWVMKNLTEAKAWVALSVEALSALGCHGASGVTVDRGRFSKERLSALCLEIGARTEHAFSRAVKIQPGASDQTPGVQVADIIVNTAGHSLTAGKGSTLARELLSATNIPVIPLRTAACLPDWLSAEA